jgi:hypothetical protein
MTVAKTSLVEPLVREPERNDTGKRSEEKVTVEDCPCYVLGDSLITLGLVEMPAVDEFVGVEPILDEHLHLLNHRVHRHRFYQIGINA